MVIDLEILIVRQVDRAKDIAIGFAIALGIEFSGRSGTGYAKVCEANPDRSQ